jgi:large subunit GTPase 1
MQADREERKQAEVSDEDDIDYSDTSDHTDDEDEEEEQMDEEASDTAAEAEMPTVASSIKSEEDGTSSRLQDTSAEQEHVEKALSTTENSEKTGQNTAPTLNRDSGAILNSSALLTREELLSLWRNMKVNTTNDVVTVGLVSTVQSSCNRQILLRTVSRACNVFYNVYQVGYPNVGKSSTINALIQSKKVAVSETPGRTKHFQVSFQDFVLSIITAFILQV